MFSAPDQVSIIASNVSPESLVSRVLKIFLTKLRKHGKNAVMYRQFSCVMPAVILTMLTIIVFSYE